MIENDPAIGSMLGPYRLLRQLGKGGMGAVYEAEHAEQRAYYAIKLLHPHYSQDEVMVERLRREALVASRLRHANIIYVTDFGSDPHLGFYIVMELLRGTALDEALQQTGAFPLSRAADVVYQITDALIHAHSMGVIHRDLKPGNVFLMETVHDFEQVKLVDFGIAHILLPHNAQAKQQTSSGKSLGTPEYMPPEQILGKNSQIGSATDIYALSVLIFRMLTGQLPFSNPKFIALLNQVMRQRPPLLSEKCPEFRDTLLERLLFQCMAKNPENRITNIKKFQEMFQNAIESDPKIAQLLKQKGPAAPKRATPASTEGFQATIALSDHPERDISNYYGMKEKPDFLFGGETFTFDAEGLISTENPTLQGGHTKVIDDEVVSGMDDVVSALPDISYQDLSDIQQIEADVPTAIFGSAEDQEGKELLNSYMHSKETTQSVSDKLSALMEEPKTEDSAYKLSAPPEDLFSETDQFDVPTSPNLRPPVKSSKWLLFSILLALVISGLVAGWFQREQLKDFYNKHISKSTTGYWVLSIETTPPKAQVVHQGQVMGQTPLKIKRKVGQRLDFILKKPGFQLLIGSWKATHNKNLHFHLLSAGSKSSRSKSKAPTIH